MAIGHHRAAIVQLEQYLGPDHIVIAGAQADFAGLLRSAQQPDEAIEVGLTSLAIMRKAHLPSLIPLTRVSAMVVDLLRERGRNAEAEAVWRETLNSCLARKYPFDDQTAATVAELAALLRGVGRQEEAADLESKYKSP